MLQRAAVPMLWLLVPASVIASDFSDFRIPASTRGSWLFAFQGSAFRETSVEPGIADRQGSFTGLVNGIYSLDRDSDPAQWSVRLDGAFFGARDGNHRDFYSEQPGPSGPLATMASSRSTSQQRIREDLILSASTRRYPFARPIGLEASGSIRLGDQQNWYRMSRSDVFSGGGPVFENESHRGETRWIYGEDGSLDVSAGYGRIRDATVVFDVLLLEERLERDRVLLRPVSPAARQRLAELFSLRASFGVPHDHPDKFFWQEVERLLREDGALGESGFDAYALRHASESLELLPFGFARRAGWFAGPLVSARYAHSIVRMDGANDLRARSDGVTQFEFWERHSSRQAISSEGVLVGGRVEVRLPIGTRTQFDWEERALFAGEDEPERLIASGQVRLLHLVAERWLFSAGAQHQRRMRGGELRFSDWSASANAGCAYYLEDALSLSLNVNQSQFGYERLGSPSDKRRINRVGVMLGIQLARGRFDAPGLIQPVRPMN